MTMLPVRTIIALVACVLWGAGASANSYFDSYEKMGDWSRNNTKGGINVSTFMYMDINRNGEYDAADKPMAGVINEIYSADQRLSYIHSNANGWANFRLSKFEGNAIVKTTGSYRFKILPPPQWTVSSGNAEQTIEVVEVYGSIGGLGAIKMPVPVGLMPNLFVTGQASAGKAGDAITLTNAQTNAKLEAKLDEKRRFTFANLEPANYTLAHASSPAPVSLALESFPIHIGDVSAPRSQAPANQIATFDDISQSELRKVPNGYKGLRWFNLNAMKDTMNDDGYINGTLSPAFIAYMSSGHPASVYADKPFAFHQAAMSISWPDAHGETLLVEYYNGSKKVGEDSITLSVFGPIIYMPQREGITEIRLRTEHYWQGVLEDMHFTVGE